MTICFHRPLEEFGSVAKQANRIWKVFARLKITAVIESLLICKFPSWVNRLDTEIVSEYEIKWYAVLLIDKIYNIYEDWELNQAQIQ